MNKKHKLFIDRVIGFVLCMILRIPAFVLEMVFKRNHLMPPQEAPKRIVVSKYLGIGSILQATPMLKGLKNKYPNSQLIFVSLKSNEALLSHYEFIDEVLCVDDSSIMRIIVTSLRVIIELISRQIDLFLDLEVHSTYGSLMCLFSCSKNRLGFVLQDRDYKGFIYTHLLYLNTSLPIRHCYCQLAQLAGMEPSYAKQEPICPTLFETDLEQMYKQVKTIFNFNYKGIIAINPNASDLRFERRWGRESFAALAAHFSAKGFAVALVGSPEEHDYVQGIMELLNTKAHKVRNVAGMFSLLEFFGFLKQCSLVVTNDSGVMNMALTLPLPQLLLAGPVNPEQYFIPNEFRTYIYYQTYCSPCTHYVDEPPCGGDNICMQLIKPEEAISVCERLLRGESVEPKRNKLYTLNSEVFGVLKHKGKL
jgi:ADP-heptose:LPS heptosyltransferase